MDRNSTGLVSDRADMSDAGGGRGHMGFWARVTGRQYERPGTQREKVVQRVHERVQEDGTTVVDRKTLRTVDSRVHRESRRPQRAPGARASLGPIIEQARDALAGIAGRASQSMRLSLELRLLSGRIGHDMERMQRKCEEQLTTLRGDQGAQKAVIAAAMLMLYQLQRELEALVGGYRQEAIQAESNANMPPSLGNGGMPSGGPARGMGAGAPASQPLVASFLDSGELKALKIAAGTTWSRAHTKAQCRRAIEAFARVLEQVSDVRDRATSPEQPYPADIAALIDRLVTVNEQMKADVKALQTPERPRGLLARLRG